MESDHDELVIQFCAITGSPPDTATTALQSTNWQLEEAVTVYFASQDAASEPDDLPIDSDAPSDLLTSPQASAPHSAVPHPTASSSAAAPPRSQPPSSRMRTIRDLQGQHDGSGSDSEEDPNQNFFAGGEKSGLAVENPNRPGAAGRPDHFNNIVNQARRNAPRPDTDDEQPARPSHFTGRAQTLGGDDAPSQLVQDEDADTHAPAASLPRVERRLHLWRDGFSIDDGPLHRFDDPANAQVLALINQGRAPLALLGVQPGQEVDLQLDTHKDQDYVAPKQKYKPFGGQGQRLGSPTPGASSSVPPPPQPAAAPASTSTAPPASPTVDVDESAPTVTLQIRLGDGTRLQSRFNTTHTVGHVYDFVNSANSASTQRSYVLMTTFPNKDLADKSAVLGDMAEFKRGGVVVQKWT